MSGVAFYLLFLLLSGEMHAVVVFNKDKHNKKKGTPDMLDNTYHVLFHSPKYLYHCPERESTLLCHDITSYKHTIVGSDISLVTQ